MKKVIFTSWIVFFSLISFAQLVQGELTIKEQSKLELSLQSGKAVNLYADFRENKYPIQFAFTGNAIPLNSDKKMVVQFEFTTIVKKDGQLVRTIKRNPIPFFPGDMLMPVETFDFISILSNLEKNPANKISEIPKGNYEIILQAKPIDVKGEIKPVRLLITVS
jgi:hypothetical protein